MSFEGLLSLELENGMRNSVPCSSGMETTSLNSFIPNPFQSPAYKKNRTFHRRCFSDPVDLNVLSEDTTEESQLVQVPVASQHVPVSQVEAESQSQMCRRRNSEPILFEKLGPDADSKYWRPFPEECPPQQTQLQQIVAPGLTLQTLQPQLAPNTPQSMPFNPNNNNLSPTSLAMRNLPNSTLRLSIQEPSNSTSSNSQEPSLASMSPTLQRSGSHGKMTPPLHPNRPTPKQSGDRSPKTGDKRAPRGRYRCGRCGKPKANHVCSFVADSNSRDAVAGTESCLTENDRSAAVITAVRLLTANAQAWADVDIQTPLISPSADCDANLEGMHILTPKAFFFPDDKSSMDSSRSSDEGDSDHNPRSTSHTSAQMLKKSQSAKTPQRFRWDGVCTDLEWQQSSSLLA